MPNAGHIQTLHETELRACKKAAIKTVIQLKKKKMIFNT